MKDTLTVRTLEQAALFDLELKGQISDGMWEDARPGNHYEVWCGADVVVGDEVGCNFRARKTNYQFDSPELISIVGTRMILYVKLARAFGLKKACKLRNCFDLMGNFRPCTHVGDYYDEVRAMLQRIGEDEVRQAAMVDSYTDMDLKKDLRELKKTIKIRKDN